MYWLFLLVPAAALALLALLGQLADQEPVTRRQPPEGWVPPETPPDCAPPTTFCDCADCASWRQHVAERSAGG